MAPQLVRTMKGHSGAVLALAASPDGRFVYSGSYETVKQDLTPSLGRSGTAKPNNVMQWDATSGTVRAAVRAAVAAFVTCFVAP